MKSCSGIMRAGGLRSRRPGTSLAALAVLAVGAALAGCGSSGSASSGSPAASSAGASSSAASGDVAYAQKQVTAGLAEPAAPVPTDPVKNVAALKGKTVYYIPISADVPAFAITGTALKTALSSVGIKLNICSGEFNPSKFNSCLSQAIAGNAGGIVLDAVPYQITGSLIKTADSKNIPVVVTDVTPLSDRPTGKNIAYIAGANNQYKLAEDWIIADSGGKANALELEDTESPSSTAGTETFGIPELKAHCAGCTTTVLKFTSSNQNLLPSLVSAALLKDPDINYIYTLYDQYVPLVLQGVQQASATSRVKLVATAAALSGLQSLASGTPVKAEVADNQVYNGWIDADQVLRLMAGQDAWAHNIPIRLFTSDNIDAAKLTTAAQDTGEWFGPTDYQQKFQALWGAS